MESWRKVWRDGIAPGLTTVGLKALRTAVLQDDTRLTQGATTMPPPLQSVLDRPVEGACVVGFCAWQGDGKRTVGDVEEAFARACYECDQRMNEPAAIRWFLNWFDEVPRMEMRRHLLHEVDFELSRRRADDVYTPSMAAVVAA
jgi:hypothetical protein